MSAEPKAVTTKRKRSEPDAALSRELQSLRMQLGDELGSRRQVSGIRLQLGDIDEEYVPNLKTIAARMHAYDRMSNDPQIRGQLRAIEMTMISCVRWKVEGGSARARKLVEDNLLRRGPRRYAMATSWMTFVFENLGTLVHGFAPFGISWRQPVDGRMLIDKLTWLHPRSVDEDGWDIDDEDHFRGIRRSYMDGEGRYHSREFLSADDLFIATWNQRGQNWEGNAFIRPMYRPWLLNEMAEKIDIIDLQNRGVGIPVAHLSGAGGTKERDTLIEILKSLRGGSKERAFIVLEKEEKVGYLLSEGQAKDAGPILAHHGSNITRSAGGEWFDQGSSASGSRAGASALAVGFFVNVDGIRTWMQDQFNEGAGDQPGIVERLVERNFGPDEPCPRIIGSRVSPAEQLDNVPLMLDSIAKGAIPPNLKHANEISDKLGYSVLTEDEWDEAQEARKSAQTLGPGSPAMGGPGRPDGAGEDDRGRDDVNSRRLAMAEKKTLFGGSRPPGSRASYPWLRSMTS